MTQLTERGERTGRKRTAYSLIVGVILLTIPCYLLGFALLWIARPNQVSSQPPTATLVATVPVVATQEPLPATPTQFDPNQATATATAQNAPAATATPAANTATPAPATPTALPTITPTASASPTATETATPPLPPTETATPIPLPTDTLAPLVPLVTDTPGLPTDTPTPAP